MEGTACGDENMREATSEAAVEMRWRDLLAIVPGDFCALLATGVCFLPALQPRCREAHIGFCVWFGDIRS